MPKKIKSKQSDDAPETAPLKMPGARRYEQFE
jgi:hypothetical protein